MHTPWRVSGNSKKGGILKAKNGDPKSNFQSDLEGGSNQ